MDINKNKKSADFVSASELAQMGVCERLIKFEHKYGKAITKAQSLAMKRGQRAHEQFLRRAIVINPKTETTTKVKPWCFIASSAFSPDAPETEALRQFRDVILRKSHVGRALIRRYYHLSPVIAGLMERNQWMKPTVRCVLRPVIFIARLISNHSHNK